jgi:hypothetical protein
VPKQDAEHRVHTTLEITVRGRQDNNVEFTNILQDPHIRLVMDSDGVTEDAMVALMDQLSLALVARKIQSSGCISERPAMAKRDATVGAD